MVTEYVGLVDTDRDELRRADREARIRFDQLIRTASPHDRPRGMDWTARTGRCAHGDHLSSGYGFDRSDRRIPHGGSVGHSQSQ